MRFAENGVDVFKSLRPLYMALVDPDSTQNLRQLREKLSQDMTNVIDDFGPKVFSDFDRNNVFRSDSTSKESVSELAEGGRTFSHIASLAGRTKEFFDDTQIFNWSKEESENEDDQLYFLDKRGGVSASASDAEYSNPLKTTPIAEKS
jgi:glycerol-3-phosphate O-acyltransferase/dihydroxyacetone phosphate acyltransferase